MTADLASDTAVHRLDQAGEYAADLPDAWSYLAPSGGALMTVALRAIRAELADAALVPISATALFCSRVPAGPLRIRVEILRRGNAAAQVRAALSAPATGELGLEVSATFGRVRPGRIELLDAAPPVLPGPAEARPFDVRFAEDAPFTLRFFENFETRIALGYPWWEAGWQPGEARFARWMRYLAPQRLADGSLDPLAIPPIADTMPPALRQKLGPEAPFFHAPSLDLTVHFLDPTPSEWLLVDAHARRARAGYASAEAEIWSEDGRLVAYATQTMMLREGASWSPGRG